AGSAPRRRRSGPGLPRRALDLHSFAVTGRKLDDEARALPFGRLNRNATAEGADEPLGDEEADPGPARLCVAHPVELREDPLLFRVRDPDALVGDRQDDRVAAPPGRDGHAP